MVHDPDYVTRLEHRAEELRTIAEGMRDPENRDALLKWAEEYNRTIRGLSRVPKNDARQDPDLC
jgi:hypothetical protein